jgi:hypothetical protein
MPEQDTSKAPKCPHCLAQPLVFGENTIVTPNGTVVWLSWCDNCRVTLNIMAVGKQPVMAFDPTRKDGGMIKLM